jgi:hypothetical protein
LVIVSKRRLLFTALVIVLGIVIASAVIAYRVSRTPESKVTEGPSATEAGSPGSAQTEPGGPMNTQLPSASTATVAPTPNRTATLTPQPTSTPGVLLSPTSTPGFTLVPPSASTLPPLTTTPVPPFTATPAPPPTPRPVPPPAPGAGGAVAPGPAPTPTLSAPSPVDITLTASPSAATVGQQVNVSVVVNAAPSSPVDAVQVYLDFDDSMLQVVSIAGGTVLSEELQSNFDNNLGQISYAAGTLRDSVGVPFTLITVNFQTTAATDQGGTDIVFAPLVPPRHTKVAAGAGRDVTGSLTPVSLLVQ